MSDLRSHLEKALLQVDPNPAGCPDLDRLRSAVRGELAAEEVADLARHAVTCPRCREEWEVELRARRLAERPRAATVRSMPPPEARRPRPSLWKLPAAAAALLAVGLYLGRGSLFDSGPVYLGPGDELRIESAVAEAQPLGEDLLLRWRLEPEVPEATYDVSVSYLLATVFEATGLSQSEVAVPSSALAAIPLGATLQWSVTTRLDGRLERADFLLRLE